MKQPTVYILASRRNGTLYVGVTANLLRRVWEHKEGIASVFTRRYGVKQLVYYEFHENMVSAITREKQLKNWRRAWKIDLIEKHNARWEDLFPALC